jgi:hypothetical protein
MRQDKMDASKHRIFCGVKRKRNSSWYFVLAHLRLRQPDQLTYGNTSSRRQ